MHISRKSKRRDELEFLPAALEVVEAPPAPFGRILAISISAFFILVILWASFGTTDVISIAQGRIIPTGRIKVVQPLDTGLVRAIHITEGQQVSRGDLLIELDPTESDVNLEILKFDLSQAEIDEALGRTLLSDNPIDNFIAPDNADADATNAARSLLQDMVNKRQATATALQFEIQQTQASVDASIINEEKFSDTLPLINEQLIAKEQLYKKNIVTKPEVTALKLQFIEQKAALLTSKEAQKQARATIEMLRARKQEQAALFRENAATMRRDALGKIASLSQQILKEEQRQEQRKLYSPVSGTVHQLAVHTVGAVVNVAEQLVTIVPDDAPLEIEAFISNKDIGFVEEGLPVGIKYEAFPFTRYGITTGTLLTLSHDAIINDQLGPVYKATVQLKNQFLKIEGKQVRLAPGMVASIEIKTGRRKIIDFFLSPLLRYKDEAIRER